MDYEHKYLKYKAKYIAAKAQLNGGSLGKSDSLAKSKSTKKVDAVELHTRNIKVLEYAIQGRTNRIKNTEDFKNRGVEKLTKNNAPKTEIDELIETYNFEINNVKKELNKKNIELQNEKEKLEKAKLKNKK
jgi:hypothetical protein